MEFYCGNVQREWYDSLKKEWIKTDSYSQVIVIAKTKNLAIKKMQRSVDYINNTTSKGNRYTLVENSITLALDVKVNTFVDTIIEDETENKNESNYS